MPNKTKIGKTSLPSAGFEPQTCLTNEPGKLSLFEVVTDFQYVCEKVCFFILSTKYEGNSSANLLFLRPSVKTA